MTSSARSAPVRMDLMALEHEHALAARLTLDRPESLNAMDGEMIAAMDSALDAIQEDERVRVVLVTGEGRAFSAGGDLKGYQELQSDPVRFPEFVESLHGTFGRFRRLRVPAVALVNGVTAAGGLELLLACDFALVAESARVGDAHLNFGQMGGGGVLSLLPRMVGWQRATELVFSGRFLSAAEAVEWGLASAVVPDDELLAAGLAFAESVARKSPLAVANAKRVMRVAWEERLPLDASLRLERETNSYYCLLSEDAKEGLRAFSEKRTPRFRGR